MRLIILTVLAGLIVATGSFRVRAASNTPLKGAWKAVEIGAGQNTRKMVGLAIFTDAHYSIMDFDAESERPDIADISKASADEMRALWAGWVANTGTYEVNGDLATIHPMGAKIPVVMKPGASEVYRFRIEGDTLSWTQQRNARGAAVTNAATTKFVRVE
jgi:hypothetical protein